MIHAKQGQAGQQHPQAPGHPSTGSTPAKKEDEGPSHCKPTPELQLQQQQQQQQNKEQRGSKEIALMLPEKVQHNKVCK